MSELGPLMISLPVNENCTFLRELALELDGALGSLERCLIFRLGPSYDTFTITRTTVDTRVSINMYISQRQPAILDVREVLTIKVHTHLDNISGVSLRL